MPRYRDTDINGFIIQAGEYGTNFGPFDTPEQAGEWAVTYLPLDASWVIRPMLEPAVGDPESEAAETMARLRERLALRIVRLSERGGD